MKPTATEQLYRADKVIDAICKVGKIDYPAFVRRKKSTKVNILRGVACVIVREQLVHPRVAAMLFRRNRSNVCNQQRKYIEYLQVRDKAVMNVYNQVNDILNGYKEL